jgi:hypothetical protein
MKTISAFLAPTLPLFASSTQVPYGVKLLRLARDGDCGTRAVEIPVEKQTRFEVGSRAGGKGVFSRDFACPPLTYCR